MPRPPGPWTAVACASSTISAAPYFSASAAIAGSGAMSPSMLKTLSVTMTLRQGAPSFLAKRVFQDVQVKVRDK